jgi:hypothetical protein
MKMKVASPCKESWERMRGDDRSRFCARCRLNVYNLSAMGLAEAEDLVRRAEGHLCVRFYQRRDGTVLASDCPAGWRRKVLRRVAVVAGLLLVVAGATAALGAGQDSGECPGWLADVLEWLGVRPRAVLGGIVKPR